MNNMSQCDSSSISEFTDHTSEVTKVKFSNGLRAFSASLDKLFKVYDIAAKCVLKNI
jgi:WD40 repeat protein